MALIFRIALFSTFLLLSLRSEAQTKSLEYGLKAGINFAELYGADAIPESDRKVGYSAGFYGKLSLQKELNVQLELLWSLQGEEGGSEGRYKVSYLNLPFLLKWHDQESGFYSELGPQLGFLVINSSKNLAPELAVKELERLEVSLALGAGYKIDADWSVGLRYIQGISPLIAGKELYNSVLYLGFSYFLF